MLSRLLTLNEKIEWSNLIDKLPIDQQDIYYTPDYYELCERNGDGEAMCFVYEGDGDIAMYPFLLNSVNRLGYELDKEYFDIQGVYGYNGALFSSCSAKFLKDFSQSLLNYCREHNVITEFTRFNPILKNHVYAKYLSVVKMNKNIIVDLTNTEENIWNSLYDHSVRKNVRKAHRSRLTTTIFNNSQITDKWLNDFKRIYYDTLKRNQAENYYYFDDDYFLNITKLLKYNGIFFFVLKDNKPISCELVTYKNNKAYSFLGGTLSEYFPYRPNDLLKHEIILHLKNIGVEYFCLGGGTSKNDGIFKYKKSFSKNGDVNFYIGETIYNHKIYDYVCKKWTEKYPDISNKFSNRLLKYREII